MSIGSHTTGIGVFYWESKGKAGSNPKVLNY